VPRSRFTPADPRSAWIHPTSPTRIRTRTASSRNEESMEYAACTEKLIRLAEPAADDIHTHLVEGGSRRRSPRYRLVSHGVSELYAAGCPTANGSPSYPGSPDPAGGCPAPRPRGGIHELTRTRASLGNPDHPARPLRDRGAGRRRSWAPPRRRRPRRAGSRWAAEVMAQGRIRARGPRVVARTPAEDDALAYSLEWGFSPARSGRIRHRAV